MDDQNDQQAGAEAVAHAVFELTKEAWLKSQRRRNEGDYELSESEFLTLDAIQQYGTMTVGDLQRRVQVLPAQMSRIIRSLETRHVEPLVSCAINSADKRKINVQITARGTAAADRFRQHKIEQIADALGVLSDEDLRQLRRIVLLARKSATQP